MTAYRHTRLARLDQRAIRQIRRESIRVNRERTRAAYILEPGMAVVDGIPGPTFEYVQNLAFSPDGGRVSYVASTGPQKRVVIQGMAGTTTIGEPVDEVLSQVVFSPDGASCSYTARVGDRYLVMVDLDCVEELPYVVGYDAMLDAPGPRYTPPNLWSDALSAESADFQRYQAAFLAGQRVVGPGGRHWIQAKERPVGSSGAWTIVIDGMLSQRYLAAEGPAFSSDGEHIAYWTKERAADNECVHLDGKAGPVFAEIPRLMPFGARVVFTPGTNRLLYKASRRMRWHIVIDGDPGPESDWVGDFDVAADGERVGYAAISEHEVRWVERDLGES